MSDDRVSRVEVRVQTKDGSVLAEDVLIDRVGDVVGAAQRLARSIKTDLYERGLQ